MEKPLDSALVWFRRDLRIDDNAALYHALKSARRVYCVFIFDCDILGPLPRADRRVEFILDSIVDMDRQLREFGATGGDAGAGPVRLIVRHARPVEEIARLAKSLGVQAVYANHDDEPYALERDARTRGALADAGIALHTSKDHVIFERGEVMTAAGTPYTVYTPYKNAWLKKLEPFFTKAYPVGAHAAGLAPLPADVPAQMPTLADLGFELTNLHTLKIPTGSAGAAALTADFLERIDDYETARNFPAIKGPSYLSVHLRFGTVSVRRLARDAHERMQADAARLGPMVWLSELIWRDFYHQILANFPHVARSAFRPEFDRVRWEQGKTADAQFQAWCEGRTGYPLVDAAMHQINQTGYMHNRLRMVTASFLSKDLGIDYRRGEAYFAEHLNDYDLASNNGGWQWAASTGCDAQPYFRIFNPVSQSRKFDVDGKFIRRYLPQLAGLSDELIHAPWEARPIDLESAHVVLGRDYPSPIVQHEEARARTLERFAGLKPGR